MKDIGAIGAIFVIAFGILIGQTSSHYLIKVIDIKLLEMAAEHMRAEVEAQAIETQKRNERIRKLRETCDYWSLEAERNPNSQNLTYRDAACDRYRNSL